MATHDNDRSGITASIVKHNEMIPFVGDDSKRQDSNLDGLETLVNVYGVTPDAFAIIVIANVMQKCCTCMQSNCTVMQSNPTILYICKLNVYPLHGDGLILPYAEMIL